MMGEKFTLSDIFTGILVLCALIITVLVVRQQLFLNKVQSKTDFRTISNWQQIDFNGPRNGPEDAPVEIIEFYDYQCPFCKQVQPALKTVRKNYGQQISITHQHLPLPIHEEAMPAAIAVECARDQGKFAMMHELLFDHQKQLGKVAYDSLSRQAGIPNLKTFTRCFENRETKQRITANLQQAQNLGIEVTPTLLINGEVIEGALPYSKLKSIVDKKLNKITAK